MNIKKAKEQIKSAMTAYFTKDPLGNYVIPIEKQRPVFLVGPPGIGKTAIMEQIASELGVGLLSYSMTHHTRQSAIGLPYISHKEYGGKEYSVTEYTMSEIIASIYDLMENSGVQEGILFLDEINCVSETLSPLMLQFLQYKVFGRHKIPEGWIVVTAGNPPEYNDSVREFDVVTLDRLKKIDVEPNLDVWKEYAYQSGIHPAVMTFLDIKKSYFYSVETTISGKSFVTPRGWEDLSKMLQLFEKNDLKADEDLVIQYLQNRRIAKEFAVYYDLFMKYKEDYQIGKILQGKADEKIKKRAKDARFDERLSLVGMMLDGVNEAIRGVSEDEDFLRSCMNGIKQFRQTSAVKKNDPKGEMDKVVAREEKMLEASLNSGALSQSDKICRQKTILYLRELSVKIAGEDNADSAFKIVKKDYNAKVKNLSKAADAVKQKLSNMFLFSEEVFGEGQEILIIVTELTANNKSAVFISQYGCPEYFRHNKDLLFYERQNDILKRIEDLGV